MSYLRTSAHYTDFDAHICDVRLRSYAMVNDAYNYINSISKKSNKVDYHYYVNEFKNDCADIFHKTINDLLKKIDTVIGVPKIIIIIDVYRYLLDNLYIMLSLYKNKYASFVCVLYHKCDELIGRIMNSNMQDDPTFIPISREALFVIMGVKLIALDFILAFDGAIADPTLGDNNNSEVIDTKKKAFIAFTTVKKFAIADYDALNSLKTRIYKMFCDTFCNGQLYSLHKKLPSRSCNYKKTYTSSYIDTDPDSNKAKRVLDLLILGNYDSDAETDYDYEYDDWTSDDEDDEDYDDEVEGDDDEEDEDEDYDDADITHYYKNNFDPFDDADEFIPDFNDDDDDDDEEDEEDEEDEDSSDDYTPDDDDDCEDSDDDNCSVSVSHSEMNDIQEFETIYSRDLYESMDLYEYREA
jgi:hypothetical protein